jgi:hypothetical protein
LSGHTLFEDVDEERQAEFHRDSMTRDPCNKRSCNGHELGRA